MTTWKSAHWQEYWQDNPLTSWLVDLTEEDVNIRLTVQFNNFNTLEQWAKMVIKSCKSLKKFCCAISKLSLHRWKVEIALTLCEIIYKYCSEFERALIMHEERASVAYQSIGKHLERSKVINVSSDAVHPIDFAVDSIKGSKEAGFSTNVGAPVYSSASEIYAKVPTFTDPLRSVATNWH